MFIICMLVSVIAIFLSQRSVKGEALCLQAANICGWVGMKIPIILNVGTELRKIISFTLWPL
jgi:hypothetical protein